MESSKATTKHIKQVASDWQATEINLMHHQCTEFPPKKFQRKQKKHFKSRQDTNKQKYSHDEHHKQYYNDEKQRGPPVQKKYDNYQALTGQERCKKCGDSRHIEEFRCLASKHQCRNCHKYGHFSSLCYKKSERSLESRPPKAHKLKIGSVCAQDSICGQLEDLSSSDNSFCLQMKIKSN